MFNLKFFDFGTLMVSDGVSKVIEENNRFTVEVCLCLKRYCVKDFEDISAEERQKNNDEIQRSEDICILATYMTCKGKIYIITRTGKAGQNITTVCFEDER